MVLCAAARGQSRARRNRNYKRIYFFYVDEEESEGKTITNCGSENHIAKYQQEGRNACDLCSNRVQQQICQRVGNKILQVTFDRFN